MDRNKNVIPSEGKGRTKDTSISKYRNSILDFLLVHRASVLLLDFQVPRPFEVYVLVIVNKLALDMVLASCQ